MTAFPIVLHGIRLAVYGLQALEKGKRFTVLLTGRELSLEQTRGRTRG